MKNYRIILGSFIVSALFLSSCQDIDLLPKDNMPDELFWKTPDDFEKEVNWLYTRTETFGTKDTDSDIAYELNENTTSNGTLIAPNTDALWDSTFIDLRQSNMIIEKSQTYEGDPSEIERYVAEARFFRAYSHFRLMAKYNDIPILTKVLTVDSPELYGSRNKQQEVEDFILSELNEVYAKLPLQSELSSDEAGRVTQGAALSPLAGTYSVEAGGSFSFSLTLDTDCDQSTPMVKVGDKLIEPTSDGKYEIKNINSDITISITGIVKNATVGNAEVESNALKIWGSNGVLHIQSAHVSTAYIMTFGGQLYKALTLPIGETMITIPQGAYIIRIENQSYKIRF